MPVVVIFGTSVAKPDSREYDAAERIGCLLAEQNIDIATGGYGGVMEATLRGASNFDVRRIGVVNKDESHRQVNKYVTELIETNTYIDRLIKLIGIANAYIVLSGGTGTLLELAAAWALLERKLIVDKPIVCLGDQWYQIAQIMGFYSEKTIDRLEIIYHAESVEHATGIILKYLSHKYNS